VAADHRAGARLAPGVKEITRPVKGVTIVGVAVLLFEFCLRRTKHLFLRDQSTLNGYVCASIPSDHMVEFFVSQFAKNNTTLLHDRSSCAWIDPTSSAINSIAVDMIREPGHRDVAAYIAYAIVDRSRKIHFDTLLTDIYRASIALPWRTARFA